MKIVFSVNVLLNYISLLIVSSLNRFAVCFQSFMNIACRNTQNAARIKRFLRLHIVIKPLINTINPLSCGSVTLLKFLCKFGACQKLEPAGRDFGNFLNGFAN